MTASLTMQTGATVGSDMGAPRMEPTGLRPRQARPARRSSAQGSAMSHGNDFTLRAVDGLVQVHRDRLGYPTVTSGTEPDMFFGLGYMHAIDRQVQMWITRVIGRGQGSQHFDPSPEMIEVDKYLRWLDLAGDAEREVALLGA